MPTTEAEAVLIAAAMCHGTAYQGTASVEIALVTSLPTATVAGTEVTGGAYARVTKNLSSDFTRDGTGGFYNTAAITFPTLTGTDYSADVVAVEMYSAADHTTRLRWLVLDAPVTKFVGDTPQFPACELYFTVI